MGMKDMKLPGYFADADIALAILKYGLTGIVLDVEDNNVITDKFNGDDYPFTSVLESEAHLAKLSKVLAKLTQLHNGIVESIGRHDIFDALKDNDSMPPAMKDFLRMQEENSFDVSEIPEGILPPEIKARVDELVKDGAVGVRVAAVSEDDVPEGLLEMLKDMSDSINPDDEVVEAHIRIGSVGVEVPKGIGLKNPCNKAEVVSALREIASAIEIQPTPEEIRGAVRH